MADRWLRDGLLRSARWNDLPCESRDLYVRLLLVVDDFGCFDGREGVISSQCYPLKPISLDLISELLVQLHVAELIVRYSNKARPFIAITQWKHGLRGKRRYPAPPVDVDLPISTKIAGKFKRPVGWWNPPGYDQVSTLVDYRLRPVAPQPEEWRPVTHLGDPPCDTDTDGDTSGATKGVTPGHPKGQPSGRTKASVQALHAYARPMGDTTGAVGLDVDLLPVKGLGVAGDAVAGSPGAPKGNPAPTPTSTDDGDDKISWEQNHFKGLSERQRLAWQETFEPVRIPVQVELAETWLQANPAERALYERGERGGLHGFLVRWLLREFHANASLNVRG